MERVLIDAVRHHLNCNNLPMARLVATHGKEHQPSAEAWAVWSLLCLHGDAPQAEEGFQSACRAVEMNPTSSIAYLALARAHLARADTEAARVAAERSLTLDPEEHEAAALLGSLHRQRGDGEKALALLATAADRLNASEDVLVAAAELLLNQQPDSLERAMVWLVRAIAKAPHTAEARALKAMVHVMRNELHTGRRELLLALGLHPGHPEILYQLARLATIEASEPELDDAIAFAQRAVALVPGHWRARLVWSALLERRGRHSDAFKLLTDALTIEPKAPELWLSLARQAALLGQHASADNALRHARDAHANAAHLAAVSREVRLLLGDWKAVAELDRHDESGREVHAPWGPDMPGDATFLVYARSSQELFTLARFLPAAARRGGRVVLCLPPQMACFASLVQGVAVRLMDVPPTVSGIRALPLAALPYLLREEPDSLPAVACISPDPQKAAEIADARSTYTGPCWFLGPALDDMLPEFVKAARSAAALVVAMPDTVIELRRYQPTLPDDLLIEVDDWDSLCAWMRTADAVILADDILALVAGAQGISADVVLGHQFDPLWGWNAQQPLWFPSIRLHRPVADGHPGAWHRIAQALELNPTTALEPAHE